MADARADLTADLRRVADRLATAPVQRVATVAGPARQLLQALADAAAGIDACDAASAPPWREVPVLPDTALGDQVTVLGRDLIAALNDLDDRCDGGAGPGAAQIWSRTGRVDLKAVLDTLAADLRALRMTL